MRKVIFLIIIVCFIFLTGFKGCNGTYFVVEEIIDGKITILVGDGGKMVDMPYFEGAVEGGVYKITDNKFIRDYEEEERRINMIKLKLKELEGKNND